MHFLHTGCTDAVHKHAKSHVSHISQKLGVNRRSEARTAEQKLGLVPKDL